MTVLVDGRVRVVHPRRSRRAVCFSAVPSQCTQHRYLTAPRVLSALHCTQHRTQHHTRHRTQRHAQQPYPATAPSNRTQHHIRHRAPQAGLPVWSVALKGRLRPPFQRDGTLCRRLTRTYSHRIEPLKKTDARTEKKTDADVIAPDSWALKVQRMPRLRFSPVHRPLVHGSVGRICLVRFLLLAALIRATHVFSPTQAANVPSASGMDWLHHR